jgi:hypothetical protein
MDEQILTTEKPILGFRIWRVTDTGKLVSVIQFDTWRPGTPLVGRATECYCFYSYARYNGYDGRTFEGFPCASRCEYYHRIGLTDKSAVTNLCGIYSYNSVYFTTEGSGNRFKGYYEVVGGVYIWGKIIVHDFGYRSQYAYPAFLINPSEESPLFLWSKGRDQLESIAKNYGIPVVSYEEAEQISDRLSYPWLSKS